VSRQVNSVRNNDASLIVPLDQQAAWVGLIATGDDASSRHSDRLV
jgi:hypothetical protein